MAISRNEVCPCGSGLKYKKCCLGSEPEEAVRLRKVTRVGAALLAGIAAVVGFQYGAGLGAAVALGGFGLLGGFALIQDS